MSDSATRGAASLVCLCASLALGQGRAQAAGTAQASERRTPAVPVTDSLRSAKDRAPVDGSPLARIDVETGSIFDPAFPGRLSPLYHLADRLHVRTRAATIRNHMVFEPGEPWTEARAKESARQLRALDIFNSVEVRGRQSGDSVVALVRTRDAWTTNPEISVERGGGRLFGSFRFSERNLFGRAQQIGFSYRKDPAGISRSVELGDPGVGGSHVVIGAHATEGTGGTSQAAAVSLPFYSEDAPRSFSVVAERVQATAHLFGNGVELASFSRRIARVEVSAGHGWRVHRTIVRLNASFLGFDRGFGTSSLAPGAPPEFGGGEERLRLRRFTLEGRLWRPHFVERTGVNQLDGIEDTDLGRYLAVALGFSPRVLGGTADEGYASVRLSAGAEARRSGFGWLRAGFSTRLVSGLREATGVVEAHWVNQSIPRHSLVLAAQGAAGWHAARDFQMLVGGLSGLRAHDVYALSGDRLWRWNAESRWAIKHEIAHLISVGVAGFWDAAQTRGPGSGDAPWQHDVGLGLRLGFPRSAGNHISRFDVAWPISPSGHAREAVFSFGSSQSF